MVSEAVVEDATTETPDGPPSIDAEEVTPVETIEAEVATSIEDGTTPDASDDATEAESFPSTLTELREKFPKLAEAAEYAGAQSRESILRKEMGNEATATARLTQYREALIANPEDNGATLKAIIQDRDLNVAATVMQTIGDQALTHVQATDTQKERSREKLAKFSGTQLTEFASELWEDALEGAIAVARTEWESERDADVQRLLGEEMTAQKIEATPKRAEPPATPAGTAPSTGTYDNVEWVQTQMANDDSWLNKLSPDGKKTNLARARPAIDALARERKKQRANG